MKTIKTLKIIFKILLFITCPIWMFAWAIAEIFTMVWKDVDNWVEKL